jgi:transposase
MALPKQHSSGGKKNLLAISKRGDTYMRTLLIDGVRSVINRAQHKPESCSWINRAVSLNKHSEFKTNQLSLL